MSATQKMIDELERQRVLAAELNDQVRGLALKIIDMRWPLTTEARANLKEAKRFLKRMLKELR